MPYDILVCAHGEQPATFGVKGVEEYAFFMKEVGQPLYPGDGCLAWQNDRPSLIQRSMAPSDHVRVLECS